MTLRDYFAAKAMAALIAEPPWSEGSPSSAVRIAGAGESFGAAANFARAAYLMAVGGSAYLVSKAVKKAKVLAFGDLGMEAIYEFEVKDMPVTVAVDAKGTSVHATGPAEWEKKIREFKIPLNVA